MAETANPLARPGGRTSADDAESKSSAMARALAWAAKGYYVFPVDAASKSPKRGILWRDVSTTSAERIEQWWVAHPDAGVGVDCGKSNIVVVDVDKPEACAALTAERAVADTWWTATRREGGKHFFFRENGHVIGCDSSGKVGNGIDVKGLGGYVVAYSDEPPDRGDLAEAPRWIADKLTKAEAAPREPVPETFDGNPEDYRDYTDRAIAGIRAELLAISQGNGWGGYGSPSMSLASLALSPWSPLTVEEAGKFWYEWFHERKEAIHGERGLDDGDRVATWESAVAKAGPRPAPDLGTDLIANVRRAADMRKPYQVKTITLAEAQDVFTRWLGEDYDLAALHVALSAVAVERMDGDPVWILLVGGPGAAKTETVSALSGAGAIAASTLTSDAALLSLSPQRDKAKDATGGLLRTLGASGVLVLKDVTSILSLGGDKRASVLAALREVYDGSWTRSSGADGGRTATWTGRIAIVGAVTTAWDTHHGVVSELGDRFAVLRLDSTTMTTRLAAGRQALGNVGDEIAMREELSAAVAGVMAGVDPGRAATGSAEDNALLTLANVVTMARTAIVRDHAGRVLDAHAPEMPTRYAKQLAQLVRGARAIGLGDDASMALAVRVARDSIPPLRLAILRWLAVNPDETTTGVRRGIDKPHTTVDRELQGLHMLGLLTCDEFHEGTESRWRYSIHSEWSEGLKFLV